MILPSQSKFNQCALLLTLFCPVQKTSFTKTNTIHTYIKMQENQLLHHCDIYQFSNIICYYENKTTIYSDENKWTEEYKLYLSFCHHFKVDKFCRLSWT